MKDFMFLAVFGVFLVFGCSTNDTICQCPQCDTVSCEEFAEVGEREDVCEEVTEVVEDSIEEFDAQINEAAQEAAEEVDEVVAEVIEITACDDFVDGDLLKGSGPAVYYYQDECRHVFTNQDVFDSWYPEGHPIKTVADDCLASIALCGNMTVRPGTYLVKITTVPKVYTIEKCNLLLHIGSELSASSTYGEDWSSRVIDIADAFWPNYQDSGQTWIEDKDKYYPDQTLVRYENCMYQEIGDGVYLVEDNMLRPISEEVLAADHFSDKFVCQHRQLDIPISPKGPVQAGEYSIAAFVANCY